MNHFELALSCDARDLPIESSAEYEQAIKKEDCPLEAYLNLCVIYLLSAGDGGFGASHHLPVPFLDFAWARNTQVLDEAEAKFGRHSEIEFWRYYVPYLRLGERPFLDECKKLSKSTESLVPYFYLFAQSNGSDFRTEAVALYEIVKDRSTTRKRFVASIIGYRLRPDYQWGKQTH